MDVLGQTVASFCVNANAGYNSVSHDFTKLKSNRYIVSLKRGKTVESACRLCQAYGLRQMQT